MTKLKDLIKNNTVVVIDTETTGLSPNEGTAQIYEINARKIIDGDISNALFLYRDDKHKVYNGAIAVNINVCKVTGDEVISEYACNMLTCLNYKAPLLFIGDDKLTLETSNIKSAVKKLKRYVGKCILCGYDLAFDLKFLNQYEAFDDIQTVDLLPIVKAAIGDKVRNLQLNTVCEYFGIDVNKKSFTTLTAELLLKLAEHSLKLNTKNPKN